MNTEDATGSRAKRRRPVVLSTRITDRERALVDAAAALEGVPVSSLVRTIIVPAARQRVANAAAETGPDAGESGP